MYFLIYLIFGDRVQLVTCFSCPCVFNCCSLFVLRVTPVCSSVLMCWVSPLLADQNKFLIREKTFEAHIYTNNIIVLSEKKKSVENGPTVKQTSYIY